MTDIPAAPAAEHLKAQSCALCTVRYLLHCLPSRRRRTTQSAGRQRGPKPAEERCHAGSLTLWVQLYRMLRAKPPHLTFSRPISLGRAGGEVRIYITNWGDVRLEAPHWRQTLPPSESLRRMYAALLSDNALRPDHPGHSNAGVSRRGVTG